MSSTLPATSKFSFPLDTSVLLPGSATSVEITAATAADVLEAVAKDTKFPDRQIDLASISLEARGGSEFKFNGGSGEASFSASGSARMQSGVFDNGADVLKKLALEDADEIGFELTDQAGSRYMLFLAGYAASAKFDAKHPIGVLGAATFGIEGKHERQYAIVHRFDAGDGARKVLQDTISSWKLPRHVVEVNAGKAVTREIAPSTHLIAEAEGSLALRLGAQLGYDFSFIREAKLLGLQGDIGLKIETGIKAFVGFEVSGRYLVVLSRESGDEALRLQMFRLRKKGVSFGLNLSAKVQTVADILPENVDDLIKAVFGVHGQQVVKDLLLIEKWTDPKKDLSDTVAGLVNKTGLELLEEVTGVNPKTAFNKGRELLLDAIRKWEALPATVSSMLWAQLEEGGLKGPARKQFESALKALTTTDAAVRRKEIAGLLSNTALDGTPIGRFLIAGGEKGLAKLLDESEDLRKAAALTLDVLNGGIIEKLQSFIAERLNLDDVLAIVKKTDFDKLDGWLVQRLSSFFDAKLKFEDLDKVKDTIHAVLRKRQEIFEKARQALTRRYDFDVAFNFQKTTTRTALLDVTFDPSQSDAKLLLAEVLGGTLDNLLTKSVAGVSIRNAVLTHQITRQSSISVQMPFYSSKTTNLTDSLAQVSAQEDGGRVLFYELKASDKVIKNRLQSQLAVAASLPMRIGDGVRQHGPAATDWSYQFVQIAPRVRRPELERQIAPMVLEYFPNHFPGGPASLSTFLTDFDRAVEDVLGHPTDEFGDLLLSLEVSLPGSALSAWFQSRTKEQVKLAARQISIRAQRSLQRLIPFYYLRDLDKLHQNLETSPLLVFAALPTLNEFQIDGDRMIPGDGPIWDVIDPAKRAFMVSRAATVSTLGTFLAEHRARLIAAGRLPQANFFRPEEVGDFLSGVSNHSNFVNLLILASKIAHGAEDALKDLIGFEAEAATRPSKAIERLAEFGAEVVSTFNRDLSSVYGGDLLRPLGSMIFLEAAAALDPSIANARPNALLAMTVLKDQREFKMEDFLQNKRPKASDIAIQQRLVGANV